MLRQHALLSEEIAEVYDSVLRIFDKLRLRLVSNVLKSGLETQFAPRQRVRTISSP